MKACKKCRVEKPRSEFHSNRGHKDGLQGYCKPCEIIRVREYTLQHPAEVKAYRIKYNLNNAEQRWGNNIRLKYGITKVQYHEMFVAQNKSCAICQRPRGERKLHVDHCHVTGKIRGLLCNRCNTMLGGARDEVHTLARGIQYLAEHG